MIKYKIFLLSHKVPSILTSTNVNVKDSFFPLKWQTTDEFISFERISNCDWKEKINNVDLAKYSFVSFSTQNQTLTLFDSVTKKYVIINKQSYEEGTDLKALDFMDKGRWIKNVPKKTYFKDTDKCEFNGN